MKLQEVLQTTRNVPAQISPRGWFELGAEDTEKDATVSLCPQKRTNFFQDVILLIVHWLASGFCSRLVSPSAAFLGVLDGISCRGAPIIFLFQSPAGPVTGIWPPAYRSVVQPPGDFVHW